ncbi:MAG TPA: hypothetical protein VN329_09270 [Roseomonas sp.]|nr:hypothetical protein [Roseomonas sp.]
MSPLLHRVAVLGYPRTGTNLLASGLSSLPAFTFHPEPFNPKGVHLARGIPRPTPEERDADPLAFLRRLEAACATPILGIKLLPSHAPEVRRHVITDPAWRIIVLFRPNFLAVHASHLTAMLTGAWVQNERAEVGPPPKLGFNPQRFHAAREAFRRYYEEVLRALDAAGKPFLPINYIDLLNPVMLRNAARHAGASGPIETGSRLVKQGSWDVLSRFKDPGLVEATLASIGRANWAIEGGASMAEAMQDIAAPA